MGESSLQAGEGTEAVNVVLYTDVHIGEGYCMAENIGGNNIWRICHFPNFLKIGGF